MNGVIRQEASMGQGKLSDVDLVVSGTGKHAPCKTVDGFPAIYDDFLGRFCYARLLRGAYESTGVPVTSPAPPDIVRNAKNQMQSDGIVPKDRKIRVHAVDLEF